MSLDTVSRPPRRSVVLAGALTRGCGSDRFPAGGYSGLSVAGLLTRRIRVSQGVLEKLIRLPERIQEEARVTMLLA